MNERIEEGLKGMDLKNQILQQQPKKKVAIEIEEIPSDRFDWKDFVIFFSFLFLIFDSLKKFSFYTAHNFLFGGNIGDLTLFEVHC